MFIFIFYYKYMKISKIFFKKFYLDFLKELKLEKCFNFIIFFEILLNWNFNICLLYLNIFWIFLIKIIYYLNERVLFFIFKFLKKILVLFIYRNKKLFFYFNIFWIEIEFLFIKICIFIRYKLYNFYFDFFII